MISCTYLVMLVEGKFPHYVDNKLSIQCQFNSIQCIIRNNEKK